MGMATTTGRLVSFHSSTTISINFLPFISCNTFLRNLELPSLACMIIPGSLLYLISSIYYTIMKLCILEHYFPIACHDKGVWVWICQHPDKIIYFRHFIIHIYL